MGSHCDIDYELKSALEWEAKLLLRTRLESNQFLLKTNNF